MITCFFSLPVFAGSERIAIKTSELRSDLGGHVDLIGGLGKPLGSYTAIEGVRAHKPAGSKIIGPTTILVKKIDGVEIEEKRYLDLSHISELPMDAVILVKGFETGGFTGIPQNVSERSNVGSQKLWSFSTHFRVVEILGPASLKLH